MVYIDQQCHALILLIWCVIVIFIDENNIFIDENDIIRTVKLCNACRIM